MIKQLISFPLQFIFLVLLQVLVLNNLQFSGYINPYLYIVFIFWLPIETPRWLLMLVAFTLGLTIDIFSDTLGMHASACVFLAFCRPYVLQLVSPRDGYETNQRPSIQDFGFRWFILYASLLTLLHHLFLFYVEVFRFSDFGSTLGRALASTIFTLLLITITQVFRFNAEKKR